jgi:DNA-binding CsgD family transcriptional regulator/PAS domain-containing protein
MPTDFEARREALVGLIYDAVLDASLWSPALEGIAEITGSSAALIHGYSVDRKLYTFHELGRIDPECKRRHELYHVTNPWMRSSRFPAGRMIYSDDLIDLPKLKRTAFYEDVLRPQNLAHGLIVNVVGRPDLRVSLNVERSEASGPFGERDVLILRSLLPHLRRALELRLRVQDYRAAATAERDALDALSTGIVTFDASQRVLFANAAARSRAERLSLRLVAGSPPSGPPGVAKEILALLAGALRNGTAGTLRLSGPNRGVIGLSVTPVRGRAFGHRSHHAMASPAAIALIVDVAQSRDAGTALLAARHGLTAAELRAANALSQTSGMDAAAAMLGVSRNTMKSHAKRIYAKIGVRSQTELVQAIAQISEMVLP